MALFRNQMTTTLTDRGSNKKEPKKKFQRAWESDVSLTGSQSVHRARRILIGHLQEFLVTLWSQLVSQCLVKNSKTLFFKCYYFSFRMILKWPLCGLLSQALMQILPCQSTLWLEYWAANITWSRKRCRPCNQKALHPPQRNQLLWLAHIFHLILCYHA